MVHQLSFLQGNNELKLESDFFYSIPPRLPILAILAHVSAYDRGAPTVYFPSYASLHPLEKDAFR